MTSTSSTVVKSLKKESRHILTWIIEDFYCFGAGVGVNLPAVDIEFDLCNNMHFVGRLSLEGDTCKRRKLLVRLKCTSHKYWKVCFTLSNSDIIGEQGHFQQDLLTRKYSLCSYHCLLRTNPATLLCTISHASYEPASQFVFPIKESKFKHEFSQHFETKKFSDVLFKVADKEISAHKNILALRSPVFGAMFEHRMKESLSNTVVIDDIEPDVFEEMLRFIYCDEVHNIKALAAKLLPASDKYDLPTLKSICEKELAEDIAIGNAAETFILADLHRAEELKKWALNFMKTNRTTVAQTKGWKELLKSHTQLLDELLVEMFK